MAPDFISCIHLNLFVNRAIQLLQKVKGIHRGASHAIIQDTVPWFDDIVKMIKERKEVSI